MKRIVNVKTWVLLLSLFIVMTMVTACGTQTSKSESSDQGSGSEVGDSNEKNVKVIVGGKDFTEQHVLAKMTGIYLKEKGYEVEDASNMGSTVVRSALENGQIDMYWEYTGTALVIYQKEAAETDPDKAYTKVKENDEKDNLIWLNKANFDNTYALLMREEQANELNITTISDLAAHVNKNPDDLQFASNAEFYARDDGLKGVEGKYGFQFPSEKVTKMDTGLLYNALKDGQVDVSVGFATDGRIEGFQLVALQDDKQFFPAYNGVPVVRQELLDKSPELEGLLNDLADHLDADTMINLNYMVDVEHKDVAEVVREWLTAQELIE